MWRQQAANAVSAIINGCFLFLTVALALVNASSKTDAARWRAWGMESQLLWLQENTVVVAPLLIVAIALAQLGLRWSASPRIWSTVHGVLDEFRDHVFYHLDQPEHERRVTLFKYVRLRLWFCWPMTHWVVPVERSGESTRWRASVFRAPRNQPGAGEGVAGQVFAGGQVISLRTLPSVHAEAPDVAELKKYAELGRVSESKLRKWLARHPNQQLPTSICGMPVVVNGKRWGVVVLDACGDLQYDERFFRDYKLYASVLGKLLSRKNS
jgi:GAF domain